MNRPNWTDYFMGIAFMVAQRSEDPNTKHGCVILDNHNHIIGTGYNSLMRKADSSKFPKTRPEKYKFFIHSEVNAVSNCTVNLWSLPSVTAYVTGRCCNGCLQHLWQNNISTVYMAKRQGTALENEETERDFNLIVQETKMQINWVDINLGWIKLIGGILDKEVQLLEQVNLLSQENFRLKDRLGLIEQELCSTCHQYAEKNGGTIKMDFMCNECKLKVGKLNRESA